jgi:hypothetical protein
MWVARLLAAVLTFLGIGLSATAGPAFAAPATTTLGAVTFSAAVDQQARPRGQAVLFPPGTAEVWVSFEYREHEPGRRLSVLVEVDDREFQLADLTCCVGSGGRYAFPIRGLLARPSGSAYDVTIFADGVEVQSGFFAVAGVPGDIDIDDFGDDDDDEDDGEDEEDDEDL